MRWIACEREREICWIKLNNRSPKKGGGKLNAEEGEENVKQNINVKRKDQHVKGKNVLEDEDENNLNLDKGEKKTIKQRVARAVGAFAAGYTAGKMTGM